MLTTPPILIIIKNNTSDIKNYKLFAPADNGFENEDIDVAYSSFKYSFIQKTLLCKNIYVRSMRFRSDNMREILKKFNMITISSKHECGQIATIPLDISNYVSIKRRNKKKNSIDVNHKFTLDYGAGFNLSLPPKTDLRITIFGDSLPELSKMRHQFADIVIKKIENVSEYITTGHEEMAYKLSQPIRNIIKSFNANSHRAFEHLSNLYILCDKYMVEMEKLPKLKLSLLKKRYGIKKIPLKKIPLKKIPLKKIRK